MDGLGQGNKPGLECKCPFTQDLSRLGLLKIIPVYNSDVMMDFQTNICSWPACAAHTRAHFRTWPQHGLVSRKIGECTPRWSGFQVGASIYIARRSAIKGQTRKKCGQKKLCKKKWYSWQTRPNAPSPIRRQMTRIHLEHDVDS